MSFRIPAFAAVLALFTTSFATIPLTSANARVEWIDGNGRSCGEVCRRAGKNALQSGIFRNGNPFYVCTADSRNDGFRAGFNLQPNWSRACWVGYGGREVAEPVYQCACE